MPFPEGSGCELRISRIDGLAPARYPWPAYPQANPHSPLPISHFNERHRHNQSDYTDHQNTHRGTPSSNSEWRRLNAAAGSAADPLEHRPARADQDSFLRIFLGVDRHADIDRLLLLLPFLDLDRDAMRHLLFGVAQHLLAYQLGRLFANALVGE